MHILFVTPYVPSRIRVRTFHLIKSLSGHHEISLVSLVCDKYEWEMVQDVVEYCASVDLVPLSKLQAYRNCLLKLPTLMPLRAAYYRSSAFVHRIQQVIRERNIDVLHGELIKVVPTLQAVLAKENIPSLYDSVDCIAWYLEQQRDSADNPLQKIFVYTELKKMRRYEFGALSIFDQVTITTVHDRERLIALGVRPEQVQVVPNGIDTEYFTFPTAPREKDSLVFCAKLDYYPNSQAILNFCHKVLPLIWQRRPEVRLKIVGHNPPQLVRKLNTDERITVTGYVPDIRPYLAKASVALAPLLIAAGMQNKVLEALAMGTPMVATSSSCRSLQVKNGVHLLVADDPQTYADAVLRLLEDTQLAQNLGCAGRQLVEQHHSWIASANKLSELYHAISVERDQQGQPLNALLVPN